MEANDIHEININFMNAQKWIDAYGKDPALIGSNTLDYKATSHKTTSTSAPANYSKWPLKSVTNYKINSDITKNIIEQDVSADGKSSFECYPNTNFIMTQNPNPDSKDAKFVNLVSLKDQIDKGYHLFDNKQTIEGFSWSDNAKTKMAIYDSNGMVSQYDTINHQYSLIHGVEVLDANKISKSLTNKMPSQLNESDLKKLIKPVGLPPDNVKISKIFDDDNGKLTVKIEVKDNSGSVIYQYSQQYTNFSTHYERVTLPIVIGTTVGAIILLIIIVTSGILIYKKKHPLKPTSKDTQSKEKDSELKKVSKTSKNRRRR